MPALRVLAASFVATLVSLPASGIELKLLDVSHDNGTFVVTSGIVIDAPMQRVFDVLSDYDNLTELHPSIRRAVVVDRPQPHTAIVDTWIRGCAAVFCRTLKRRERIETTGSEKIHARIDGEQSNVETSETRWHLKADGPRTVVSYEASLNPEFWIPPVIGTGIVKRKLRVTLIEILTRVEALANLERRGVASDWRAPH